MKNKIIYLTLLMSAVVLIFACQKTLQSSSKDFDLKLKAKTYFEEESRYSQNGKDKRKLTLQWEKSRLIRKNDITTLLVVPTAERKTRIRKNGEAFIRYVVFYWLRDQLIEGRIVDIFADEAFVTSNLETIMKGRYLREIKGFSGKIVDYDLNYHRNAGRVYKNGAFLQGARTRFVSGNDISLKGNSNARIVSTEAYQSTEGWCLDTYVITTYPNGTETWELIDRDCILWDEDDPLPGGGGGGDDSPPAEGPGDQLCKQSFNWKASDDESYYDNWVKGMRFENGTNVNQFDAYFYIYNGISDEAMTADLPSDNAMGAEGAPVDFLRQNDDFSDLWISGDIRRVKEGTSASAPTYWYFSETAITTITHWVCNRVAIDFCLDPYACQPGNIGAQIEYRTRVQNLLKCFLPGTKVTKTPTSLTSTNTSYAVYLPGCQ